MQDLDKINLRIFSAILFVPLFIEAITVFRNGPNPLWTGIVYMSVLAFSILKIRRQITGIDLCVLIGTYSFFVLNILMFPSTLEYYKTVVMVMSLIFYIPLGCFVVRHVKNWNRLFDEIKPFAAASVLLGVYIVFVGDVGFNEEYFNYMEFSYCMLPFVASMYLIMRNSRHQRWMWLALFITGAVCMIIYGARATILFLTVFIAAFEYFHSSSRSRIYVLLVFTLIAGICIIYFDNIVIYLSGIDALSGSRLIAKAAMGQLADGGERNILIYDSIKRIETMDLAISGVFGDRAYIRGIYPHNIGLEILMQFGIILGLMIVISMLYIIVADITMTNYCMVSIFLCCVLFGRFLFSGSYIQDGSFWLWFFSMVNIFGQRKKFLQVYRRKLAHS